MAFTCVFFVLTPLVGAGYVLHQIDKQAKKVEAETSIWLVDLFSLLFLIQLPLALFIRNADPPSELVPVMTIVLVCIMTLIWWTTIKTVSRAGIHQVGWRSAISLFVIPMTYLGSFAMIGIASGFGRGGSGSESFIWLLAWESFLTGLMVLSWYIVKRAIAATNSGLLRDQNISE